MAKDKSNALKDDAAAQNKAAGVRPPIMSSDEWDKIETPEFGGQADIMELGVGEIGGPFIYVGHQEMNLEGNRQPVVVHIGLVKETGANMRLPIASSFLRAVDQAGLKAGDTFAIKRTEDVQKKGGVGKGQMMQIYSVKVLEKAATGPTPATK